MATKKIKKEKFVEPFFKELVSVYFTFCRNKFGEDPTFDGSSPRDFKSIITTLRSRATSSDIEWNLDTATTRLHNFLTYAYNDAWLRKNFLLFNINRQKDKIFFNIRAAINQQQENPFD
jgi:hypothetical protein